MVNKEIKYKELEDGMPLAVAERTILRKKSEISKENWADVAKRVAIGNSLLCPNKSDIENEQFLLEKSIGEGSLLLSGRHLQHGDEDQPKRNMEVFTNCSTAPASFLLFYLLLNGSGVGRSYDNDLILVDWDNSPNLRCVLSDTHPDFDYSRHESVRDARHKYGENKKDVIWHEVGDSREEWAKALELWENLTFEKIHKDSLLILDFSKIRPKGSPIGGMQSRPASGPKELIDAFEKSSKLKGASLAPWKQAIYIDHYFAECVLVGGARRAARMATKSWRDKDVMDFVMVKRPLEFINKSPQEIKEIKKKFNPFSFLWSSNNSVTVDADFWAYINNEKDDNPKLKEHAIKIYNAVCEASYYDGTGEPGLINVDKLTQKNDGYKELLSGNYVGSKKFQVNEDTYLYLAKIARKAKSKQYTQITNPCVAPETALLTKDGEFPIHSLNGRFVEVWNGDNWSLSLVGKTGENQKLIHIWLEKKELDFDMLTDIWVTEYHKFYLSNGGEIQAKDLKVGDILETFIDPIKVYDNDNGKRTFEIVDISDEIRYDDTYCVNEPINHKVVFNGVLTGQCGEISLTTVGGFCVIADVVPYNCESLEDAEQVFRIATRALIRVNLMDSIYNKEVKRTNRIGVGITGIHEFAWKFFNLGFRDLINEEKSKDFWLALARFNRAVKDEADKYCKYLQVSVPHTLTTIKPAGTTSKLFLLTEGWHLPSMREFLRWVQFRNDDPLVREYQNKGYPTKELKVYAGTTIVGFPTAPTITRLGMGDKLVTAAEATPEEQYKWLMLGEKYWIRGTDEKGSDIQEQYGNQISYTLKYKPDIVSFIEFKEMLQKYQSKISCCSVMPQVDGTAYEYQPEQPVSSEEYQSIVAGIDKMKEDVDFAHVDCAAGACPIDFNK